MTLDQFMCEYFRPDDVVEVNAEKLQAFFMDCDSYKRKVAELERKVEILNTALEILEKRAEPAPRLDLEV